MKFRTASMLITIVILFAPATIIAQTRLESSNYAIVDHNIDSVGGVSESSNYGLINSIGPLGDTRLESSSYALGSGFPSGIQANVPIIRCFETDTDDSVGGATDTSCTDPAMTAATGGNDTIVGDGMYGVCGSPGCYDRAKIEIDTQSNPIDTLFLVSISTDNFVSDIRYIQSDKTITSTLALANYMTLCTFQGYDANDTACDDSGDGNWDQEKQEFNVVGLQSGTTYYIRARALQGDFTETQYSPTVSTATVDPSLALDLDVDATDTETSGPYAINLGSLGTGVTDASEYIWADIDSNAFNGVALYVEDLNTGLSSGGFTINSETEDVSVSDGDGGYGLQEVSTTESSVGPLQVDAAFDLTGDNVEGLGTTAEQAFYTDTTGTNRGPITGGRAQLLIKASSDTGVPAGVYSDTITFTLIATW